MHHSTADIKTKWPCVLPSEGIFVALIKSREEKTFISLPPLLPRAAVALWDWKPQPILAKISVANTKKFSFHLECPLSSHGSFLRFEEKFIGYRKSGAGNMACHTDQCVHIEESWRNWKTVTDADTVSMLCIKEAANEVILYSAGDST